MSSDPSEMWRPGPHGGPWSGARKGNRAGIKFDVFLIVLRGCRQGSARFWDILM